MHRPGEQGASASRGANGGLTGKAPKRGNKGKNTAKSVNDMKQAEDYISKFVISKYKLHVPSANHKATLYIGGSYNVHAKCQGYSYILAQSNGSIITANSFSRKGKMKPTPNSAYFTALQSIKVGLKSAYSKGYKVVDILFQPKAMPQLTTKAKQKAFINHNNFTQCINDYKYKGMKASFVPYDGAESKYSVRYRHMCEFWAQYDSGMWEGKRLSNSKSIYLKKLTTIRKRLRKEAIRAKRK